MGNNTRSLCTQLDFKTSPRHRKKRDEHTFPFDIGFQAFSLDKERYFG